MPTYQPADELSALGKTSTWVNSPALAVGAFTGKVVLVQFWTFTCINWLRTLPYTRAWSEAYGKSGLVTVGVHTPEFGFERELANVRRGCEELNVKYPVAVDSDYRIWRAFDNHYWPALYLFDGEGKLQYRHFGEGEYDRTERTIRRLLKESGVHLADRTGEIEARGIEAPADWSSLKSLENYLGYSRTENFASPGGAVPGESRSYGVPSHLRLNQWALDGRWSMESERIVLKQEKGKLVTSFHGRDVHLVMGPAAGDEPVRFRVTIDGQAPGMAHGGDIDAEGNGVAPEQRLYQLVRQPGAIADRVLELEFHDPGVEAFAFTFG